MTVPAEIPSDRHVPAEHEGTIASNHYCRAWNGKRKHYCRARAGSGTAHSGTGRCRQHDGGGDGRVVHGMHRRYAHVTAIRIRDLVQQHEEQPDPLNILPELALVRGLLHDFIERAETNPDLDVTNAVEFAERLSRMAERFVAMNSRNAITYEQLKRFLFAAERKIEGRIRDAIIDPEVAARVVKQINRDLRGIRP